MANSCDSPTSNALKILSMSSKYRGPLKWGIIGCGKISGDFATALTIEGREHKLIGVAATDVNRAKEFGKAHGAIRWYGSYEELVKDSDVEVVYIGNLNPSHYEACKLAIDHKKHVLCEKPLCLNYKQAKEVIDLAESKKVFLMEAVWSRFFPVYQRVRELLDQKTIGDPLLVKVQFGVNIAEKDRIKRNDLGGGTILDLGIYAIQFACMVFGNNPVKVVAAGHLNKNKCDESTTAILTYEAGKTAILTTHARLDLENTAVIHGTEGTIEVSEPFWCPESVTVNNVKETFTLPETIGSMHFTNSEGLHYEAAEVRRCIQNDLLESPIVSHQDSLTFARLEDEIRRQVGVVFPADD